MSIGDGASQPVGGVDALDDLANDLIVDEQPEVRQPKPKPVAEESDDSEEAEESDDEAEEDEDEEDAEDDATVKLKVDGKEVEVKLSEALNLAQQGMDYTKKTMAVAEERKAVEQERTRATEIRTQAEQATNETLHRLQAYTQFMESQVGQMPDASMLSYDTQGYIVAKEQYEARKGQLSQAYSEIQKIGQEQARQRQAWINSTAESTEKVLKDTLPGWGDNTLNDLAAYTGKLGLSPQTAELAMLTPGFWQLAHKAQAYDAIQAKKATLKPTEKLAKVVKPSAVNQTGKATERAKREAEFNKNPSVDALANLLR